MTPAEFEEAVGRPLVAFRFRCHEASLALVRSGVLPEGARVARGSCPGVGGQHSWVVLGGDCYDRKAQVIDPTLWCYDNAVREIWKGRADEIIGAMYDDERLSALVPIDIVGMITDRNPGGLYLPGDPA